MIVVKPTLERARMMVKVLKIASQIPGEEHSQYEKRGTRITVSLSGSSVGSG